MTTINVSIITNEELCGTDCPFRDDWKGCLLFQQDIEIEYVEWKRCSKCLEMEEIGIKRHTRARVYEVN